MRSFGDAAAGLVPAAVLGCLAFIASPAGAAEQSVDLELVLATDTSRSINEQEALLQRQGVAAAFRSPQVIRAIQSGPLGRIAVAYMDWSVPEQNRVVIDWQVVSSKATAEAFADALLQASTTFGQRTSISSALQMASELIENNTFRGTRRVIDVSGDGPNNAGLSLAPLREEVLAKGIVINGLPIIVEGAAFAGGGFFADIDKYYASCVIGGRGAFLIVARGFDDFAAAIRHKLVLEVSGVTPPVQYGGVRLIPAAADYPQLPGSGKAPAVVRAPAVREQNCDRLGFGFGGGPFR